MAKPAGLGWVPAGSNDATLSALTLSAGTLAPAFAAGDDDVHGGR